MGSESHIQVVQHTGFVFSQTINVLLLYLLLTRASKNFGRYRILMILFLFGAMLYSLLEMLTIPIFAGTDRSFIFCSNGPFTNQRNIGVPLTSLTCGVFGFCLSILALQLFYRYIAICRSEKLYYFDGSNILIAMLPCLLVVMIWTFDVQFLMHPTAETEQHYYKMILDNFDLDSHNISFISMIYRSHDPINGTDHWNLSQVFGFAICCMIMTVCFSTISFCGVKTLLRMNSSSAQMSKRTKDLNRQLFLTLGLQTLLPVVTMYLPVGSLIVFPFFGIDLGIYANKVGAFIAIYPALDPFIAIMLIADFRNFVLCRKPVGNKVSASGACHSNGRLQSQGA